MTTLYKRGIASLVVLIAASHWYLSINFYLDLVVLRYYNLKLGKLFQSEHQFTDLLGSDFNFIKRGKSCASVYVNFQRSLCRFFATKFFDVHFSHKNLCSCD